MSLIKKENKPWVEKHRPQKLTEIVQDDDIIKKLNSMLKDNFIPHMLVDGHAGVGKTSAIKAFIREVYNENYELCVLELNASDDRGLDIVHEKIIPFCKSEEIISLFYKKFLSSQDEISQQRMKIACSNILSDLQSERKGITVNIQDNPYSVGSILNIYSASNINEVYLIVDQISYIDKLNTESVAEQKIKEKSNIKNLRSEYNIPILSTSCQKQRQPIIDDTREPLKNMVDSKTKKPLVDSYPLIYKGIRLICPDKEYPYPGFTQKNAICCFTKDQRNNMKYISTSPFCATAASTTSLSAFSSSAADASASPFCATLLKQTSHSS